MRTDALLLSCLPLLPIANAAPKDDLTSLKESIGNVTSGLEINLNSTAALNTSDQVQAIGYQIGASMANLGCVNSSMPSFNATTSNTAISSNSNGTNSTGDFENVYLDYVDSLSDLSTVLISRGRVYHSEFDYPVLLQLQSLTRVVYNYGKCLYNGDFISQHAATKTWNAGSDLVQAQTAWEGHQSANFPGTVTQKARRERRCSQ